MQSPLIDAEANGPFRIKNPPLTELEEALRLKQTEKEGAGQKPLCGLFNWLGFGASLKCVNL